MIDREAHPKTTPLSKKKKKSVPLSKKKRANKQKKLAGSRLPAKKSPHARLRGTGKIPRYDEHDHVASQFTVDSSPCIYRCRPGAKEALPTSATHSFRSTNHHPSLNVKQRKRKMMHGTFLMLISVFVSFRGPFLVVDGFVIPRHPMEPPSLLSLGDSSTGHEEVETTISTRRQLVSLLGAASMALSLVPSPATAAPPIAVIAEELGYFPIQNKQGEVVYVPKRVSRTSSDQSIELAKKLKDSGAVMYGAFWCPHCARQKELLGREAWRYIQYVECSPKGYDSNPLICNKKKIDGYPTWVFKDKTVIGGERPLEDLAKKVNFVGWNADLEQDLPPSLGSSACKQ